MTLDVQILKGAALEAALTDVASLRIRVFRDYPYLYDGDEAYERQYLGAYRDAPGAIVVGAFDGSDLVGASTGTPLAHHDPAFGAPLTKAGFDVNEVFYCAESVLLAPFRGQGTGHQFFDIREAYARELNLKYSAFCRVVRSDDDPRRPESFFPLDSFWKKRGYTPLPGAIAQFDWKEVGQDSDVTHDLQFWTRQL